MGMYNVTLSRAIKLVLAAQVGASGVAAAPFSAEERSTDAVWSQASELLASNVRLPDSNRSSSALNAQVAAEQTPGSHASTHTVVEDTAIVDERCLARTCLQTGSLSKIETPKFSRPMHVLTSNDLKRVNAVNVESALNTLPQVVPGLDRTSNNPGDGRATIDLRGLGAERTAVLVNGMPFAPADGLGVADLNAIPNALLKKVDVATGGASVAYGSGAAAGVVNFVLDTGFEGAELSVSHQSTESGDGEITHAELTLGSKLAGERGNFAVSFGGSERRGVLRGARELSSFTQFDSTDVNGNPILIDGGSSGVPGTAIFSGALGDFSESFAIIFNPDGSIRPFQTGEENDFYNFAPVNYLQVPQTRRHVTAIADFALSDNIELYGLGMYSDNETVRQLAPTSIFQTSTFSLDGSPFIDPAAQSLLSDAFGDGVDTDGDGIDDTATAFLRRRLIASGPRRSALSSESLYIQAGLRGRVSESWDYDLYVSHASVDSLTQQTGNVSRSRFDEALLLGLQFDSSGSSCQSTFTSASTCTPLNIFGEGNVSPEAADFIAGDVSIVAETTQLIFGARLTGTLEELPAGSARFTIGTERRENTYDTQSLSEFAFGDMAGFDNVMDLTGSTSEESVYADLYLPLMANAAGDERVGLELGYRLTNYSTSDRVSSYGGNVTWAPTDHFRVRTGYNRAHRAPAISELFVAQSEGFPGAFDPCTPGGAPLGGLSAEQVAVCIATGVPEEFFEVPAIMPGTQIRTISGGNPSLQEEQFETLSFGFDVTSTLGAEGKVFAGADYFVIDGTGVGAEFDGGISDALNGCLDLDLIAQGTNGVFCDAINRRSDGTIAFVDLTEQNVAQYQVEGVDLYGGVTTPFRGGMVNLSFNGAVLNKHQFASFPGEDIRDCAGKFGNNCGEPMPDYSHRVTASWSGRNLSATLFWRHLGEVGDDNEGALFFSEKLSAQNYLDAELSLSLPKSIDVSFGIQNITDASPPIIGDNQEQANTYPATYDVFGRTYFVRLTGSSALSGE